MPPAMQAASRHSPSWPAIQKAATASAGREDDRLALVAQHLEHGGALARRRPAGVGGVVDRSSRLTARSAGRGRRSPEADARRDDAEADTDEREDRRRAGRVVDDEAEDQCRRRRLRRGGLRGPRGRDLARQLSERSSAIHPGRFRWQAGKTSVLRPLGEVHRCEVRRRRETTTALRALEPGIQGLPEGLGTGPAERGRHGRRPFCRRARSVLVKTSTKSGRCRKPPVPPRRARGQDSSWTRQVGLLDHREHERQGDRHQRPSRPASPHQRPGVEARAARCRRRPAPPTST